YAVNNPKALPRIFQRESRRVSRPLVYENDEGLRLRKKSLGEMVAGIDALPPITGFVLTTRKDNPLVEVALVSPKPAGEDNSTVLAGWTYGLGRAVAFTSDAGARWTAAWAKEPVYDQVFGKIIRWSMRPTGQAGKFTTTFEPIDGRMQVVVNALDKNDSLLNFLTMSGTAVGPDLKRPISVPIEQTGPGRYVGSFPAREAGSYFVTIQPGLGMAPIRAGVTVPYSDEFRDRGSNDALLEQLAAIEPKGGSPGRVIEAPKGSDALEPLLAVNTFRHDLPKATSSQDAWHWLAMAACCLLLGDVFVRRVHVHFGWVPPLAVRLRDWVLRHQPPVAKPVFIERLQSRKAEVVGRIEQLRAGARFEAPAAPPGAAAVLDEAVIRPPAEKPKPAPASLAPEAQPPEESYTERLLRAKREAMEQKNRTRKPKEE
ncbi:MAG: hypothetical protein ABR915_25675, partial [Thermoguttaceae bacterium]